MLPLEYQGRFTDWLTCCRMIGLQLGTLVAQVVVIGDLGPAIVSKSTGFQVRNQSSSK